MRIFLSCCLALFFSALVNAPVLPAAEPKAPPPAMPGAVKPGSDRFVRNENGTVLDSSTDLMWPADANISRFPVLWQSARKYIQDMNSGVRPNFGHTNWRLPSIDDLETLLDKSQSYPALPVNHPFINPQNDFYWSASTNTDIVEYVWTLDMAAGNRIAAFQSYCNFRYFWPVRNTWESAAGQRGSVYSAGMNKNGQLGDGTVEDRASFLRADGLSGISLIAAGMRHAVAVKGDGTVLTWGDNSARQLGVGASITESRTPVLVAGLRPIVDAAAGMSHTLALKADGTVWAWGSNGSGQLGAGNNIEESRMPVQVKILSKAVKVSAGMNHSVALKADGTVWAWGSNAFGQLGVSDLDESRVPVQVKALSQIVSISAGMNHTLAVKSDGTVWAWGENLSGQLGDGTLSDKHLPAQVSGLSQVVGVAAGQDHSLALKNDGTVWAWGDNEFNQLGPVAAQLVLSAHQVDGVSKVRTIAAGAYHSVAVLADGTVSVWGKNLGSLEQKAQPYTITYLKNVFAAAAGNYFTLILHENAVVE